MLSEYLEQLRQSAPRIHCITNHVTSNDVANLLLALGAKPIMAQDEQETAQVAAACNGLMLNMGTPDSARMRAMLAAGHQANELGLPVVLDPVGVGASDFRKLWAKQLMDQLSFTAIRGNLSEIRTLAGLHTEASGVDVSERDRVSADQLPETAAWLQELCRRWNTILVVSGEIDLVCDSRRCFAVWNGDPMMQSVTGTGCQLTAMLTAFLAANRQQPLEAALAAVCMMGLSGEIAHSRLLPGEGSGTYRSRMLDAAFCMEGAGLEQGAKYELQ